VTVNLRRDLLEQPKEDVAVELQLLHAVAVVAVEVLVAQAHQAPKRLLLRHVHQQERGQRRLRLAVPDLRVQNLSNTKIIFQKSPNFDENTAFK